MRTALVVAAAVCYAAALAVAAAATRLPAPQPPAPVPDAATLALVADLQVAVARLEDELARRPPPPPGETAGEALLVIDGALLAPGRAALLPAARAAVRRAVPQIQADPTQLVVVEGHADSRPLGPDPRLAIRSNADLSLQRARSVADALAAEGVDPSRFVLKGWGDTRPVASNETPGGRERNRRVEVRLAPPVPGP